jgi:hypothetical protein
MDVRRFGREDPQKPAAGHGWLAAGVVGDVDEELAALDSSLASVPHPLSHLARRRVLALATGISARAPAAAGAEVNARVRAVLCRHGIFCNDLRPR